MTRLIHLRRDERGAAVIEIAIALPTLVLFIWGIFQLGIAFQANAGMQHALGEGARLATLCINPTTATGCGTPTDSQIEAKVSSNLFGTGIGTFDVDITRPVDDPLTPINESDVNYIDMTTTFTMPTNFLFFNGPNINLTRTKRVYMAG